MTITTEEAEEFARQLDANDPGVSDPVAIEFFGDVATALRTLAAERDIANEQIHGLAEERERWKERAEAAEAEAERLREALRPFAEAADAIEGAFGAVLFRDEEPAFQGGCKWSINGQQFHLAWGQFRAARAALEGGEAKPDKLRDAATAVIIAYEHDIAQGVEPSEDRRRVIAVLRAALEGGDNADQHARDREKGEE